jgi:capsular exopolysaccharide synthesis family protein
VLLIDADLRHPSLHDVFQVPNASGLGDGLKADADAKLSLIQISPYLVLLPAGRPDPDPMAGLISERMHRVVGEARARFDWVIVDTPPIGLLSDARLLAGMVDVALLVVGAGETPCLLIQKAIEAVGREKILGVVLNRAEEGQAYAHRKHTATHDRHRRERCAHPTVGRSRRLSPNAQKTTSRIQRRLCLPDKCI